jgi:hypothetical protein
LFEQFAKTTTKQAADACAAQYAAQATWQFALRPRLCAAIRPGSGPRHAVEHFHELVPILVPRKGKHTKE